MMVEELKKLPLSDILTKYPQTESVLQAFGLLHYAKTETAKYENLEASALVHAVDVKQLTDALLTKINAG